jgi:Arc/MetJ-type ribon-helix-helix transcriptional regulator
MAPLEFFFDPICPWAWITSRFTEEVARQRELEVTWRLICLRVVNERRDYEKDFPPEYVNAHTGGMKALRVAAAIHQREGSEAVGRYYTELGTRWHDQRRSRDEVRKGDFSSVAEAVRAAGLAADLADEVDDEAMDAFLRSETATALARTGSDVGTPVLTFSPGAPDEASIFGPVIARVPRGEEALRIWDAMELLTRTPGFAELKRSQRDAPAFG